MNTDQQAPSSIPPSVFLSHLRSGGLFTRVINQRIAAVFASVAYRFRLHPTVLTLVGFVLSLAGSGVVIAAAPTLPDSGIGWRIGVAVLAFVAWQAAYSLDCADGQLARVTKTTSPEGAKIDILCDIFTQVFFVAAVASVALAFYPDLSPVFAVGFGAVWMTSATIAVLDKGGEDVSLISSESLPILLAKAIRDYGTVITAVCLLVAVWPSGMLWFVLFYAALNGLYLLVLIARTASRSMKNAR
ncbi:CDP-alcohol phosphatidyltransferase family protein [Stackebrandtia nassauensis]|uniref:CDP-alcohol phosphatidyltransferase n=1 Tax=Stackebrandtia nassauensis (strain DSM 44728 / CIP 108903 / NRRL B-16338 / NBRC 102104 / LLR-40K-21) TaxID=446470 RepID=D3Q286_STANL|nr:CDP-alcohol phosphatidyltransferase family protein [Stackebrandtia nassauensis]ADD43819.1 CDP-alcohol phosphatidyltransferase [Stackebrandtia nassauensis DSM 44728]